MQPKNRPGGQPDPDMDEATAAENTADNPGGHVPGDARNDEQERKKNRERLGVNDEHVTPEMEKGHRGSFP